MGVGGGGGQVADDVQWAVGYEVIRNNYCTFVCVPTLSSIPKAISLCANLCAIPAIS